VWGVAGGGGARRWRQKDVKGMPEKSPSSSTFQLPSMPEPAASDLSASGPCAPGRLHHKRLCGACRGMPHACPEGVLDAFQGGHRCEDLRGAWLYPLAPMSGAAVMSSKQQHWRTQQAACAGVVCSGSGIGPAGAPSRCSRPRSRRPPRTRWRGGSGTCSPSHTPAPQRTTWAPQLSITPTCPDLPQHLYHFSGPHIVLSSVRALPCPEGAPALRPAKHIASGTARSSRRMRGLRLGQPAQGPLLAQQRRRCTCGGRRARARAWAGPPARGTMWIFMGWLATSSTHCAGPAKPSRYFHIVKLVGCCARACHPRPVRRAPSAQSSPSRARRSGSRTRGRAQPLSAYSATAMRPQGLRRRAVRR